MATNFVFIDETGDGGISTGTSLHFGMALLHVQDDSYQAIRQLLAYVRWTLGLYSEIKSDPTSRPAQRILEGITELAQNGVISASGLYLTKERYLGRYYNWCDLAIPSKEWPLYLRHYLLRHLLEFHFSRISTRNPIDLVMDRVSLSEAQRANLLSYLDSRPEVPLAQPFAIPKIAHLTMADSRYVGGLQTAHILADLVRDVAKSEAHAELTATSFMGLASFLGRAKE
jgi:hypothetical protein